jgi:hypothetical protein
MRFNLIHPSIVDLYVNALTLHILQEQLGEIGPDGLTPEIQAQIDVAASEYVLSARKAEQLFGSPDSVQNQLLAFSSQSQGTA